MFKQFVLENSRKCEEFNVSHQVARLVCGLLNVMKTSFYGWRQENQGYVADGKHLMKSFVEITMTIFHLFKLSIIFICKF